MSSIFLFSRNIPAELESHLKRGNLCKDLAVETYMRKTGVNNTKASIFACEKTAIYANVEV